MKKPFKIILTVVLSLALLAGATLTLMCFLRPKGQSRSDVVITPTNNTYISDNTKEISDCSPTESLFILAYNLKNLPSYYSTVSGEVDASLTTQKISGEKHSGNHAEIGCGRFVYFPFEKFVQRHV